MDETKTNVKSAFKLSKEDLEALFEGTFSKPQKRSSRPRSFDEVTGPLFDQKQPAKKQEDIKINFSENKDELRSQEGKNLSKSSLRIKYEAEVQVIKKSCGSLEEIRRSLNLSKRKMAQLLLVDPSAWTRWTSQGGEAPPHIYRSLQWFLILQEKHPELKSSLWLNSVARPQISQHEIDNIKKTVEQELIKELSSSSSQEKQDTSLGFEEQATSNTHFAYGLSRINGTLKAFLILQVLTLILIASIYFFNFLSS